MAVRILLVEDDDGLRETLAGALRRDHHAVDVAVDLAAAVECLVVTLYDVAIVDRGLPDGDGALLCRRVRSDDLLVSPRRILLLTARDAVADRVEGLDAGADDYLVKPFAMSELHARLRAVARRDAAGDGGLVVGDVEIDVVGHRVRRAGVVVDLTSREFAVLRHLAEHRGEVVSAEVLLEACWDARANPFTDSVRVIVSRLRRKLGPPPLIATVTGAGYRLEEPV